MLGDGDQKTPITDINDGTINLSNDPLFTNIKLTEFPATGGIGKEIFTASGLVLMIVAYIFMKKKKVNEKDI